MERLTDEQWMKRLPYHVEIIDVNPDAVDWCLDHLPPRTWHQVSSPHKKLPGVPTLYSSKDVFAFAEKKTAVMFKLMWWKPENIAD